ncbi:hypothetical protein V5G24_04290 [Xanthobacter sp. VTT E-85241]|uniref:hypothetical protein n=1 Tax=Roseixanthobacter finlandensis TaxID=3119922 RepID=UPI003727EAA5
MNGYAALKGAVRDLVEHAGGVTRAARVSRADAPRLSRYGSIHEEMHAPIDVIADLEQDVGDPIVTRMLAEMAGYVLVPKAMAEGQGTQFAQHLADVARSSSGVVADLAEAQADGIVDTHEAARILPKIAKAHTKLAEAEADLRRLVDAGTITPLRRGA